MRVGAAVSLGAFSVGGPPISLGALASLGTWASVGGGASLGAEALGASIGAGTVNRAEELDIFGNEPSDGGDFDFGVVRSGALGSFVT